MITAIRAGALAVLFVACGPGVKGGPTMNSRMQAQPTETAATADSPVVSHDILAREPLANDVTVKHILVSWKDLAESFQGHQDARAVQRTKPEAEALIRDLLGQIAAGADFDALMKQYSEDPGSAATGRTIPVKPDSGLVIEFRQLSLRLKPGEYGVCQSDFGFHIIKRFE